MHKGTVVGIALLAMAGCEKENSAADSKTPTPPLATTATTSTTSTTATPAPKPADASASHCLANNEAACVARCDDGDPESCLRLASLYAYGNANVPAAKDKSVALYDAHCAKDVGKACYFLASAYQFGQGVTKDEGKAKELEKKSAPLLKASCDKGDGESCNLLADMHLTGEHVAKDEAEEKRLRALSGAHYKTACETGDASSCFMAANAQILAKNEPEAFKLLSTGCDADDADSCALLAGLYEEGVGTEADPAKAGELNAKACKGGSSSACRR